jgi:hypothetical protein
MAIEVTLRTTNGAQNLPNGATTVKCGANSRVLTQQNTVLYPDRVSVTKRACGRLERLHRTHRNDKLSEQARHIIKRGGKVLVGS